MYNGTFSSMSISYFLSTLPFSSNSPHLTDVKPLYPFLIAYGASGTANVALCMAVIFALPSAPLLSSSDMAVTTSQRAALVAFYIPFLFIPALIAVDLGIRITKLIQAHVHKDDDGKKQTPDADEDRKTR